MSPGFGFNMSYTAVFDRATVDYDLSRGDNALKLFQDGAEPEVLKPDGLDGYAGEIQYFLDCLRDGVPLATVTAEDGVSALEICEAEETSVRLRQIVQLP